MKILFTISILVIPIICQGQVFNNSINSDNSTVSPNGVVSFNTLDGQLGASYLKYVDSTLEKKGFVFGGSLSAKNNKGISNIFNAGAFTPEGKINTTIGYSWKTQWRADERKITINEISNLEMKVAAALRMRDSLLLDAVIQERAFVIKNKINIDTSFYDTLKARFNENTSNVDAAVMSSLTIVKGSIITGEIDRLRKTLNFIDSTENLKIKESQKNLTEFTEEKATFRRRYWIQRYTIYGNLGMSALGFKQYDARDTVVLSNNFTDRQFEGAITTIGFNYNLGTRFVFGVNLGYRRWNTFSLLSDNEYTLRTSTVVNGTTLISEKKITGYSGNYQEFNQTLLNFDLIIFLHDGYKAMKEVVDPKKDYSNTKTIKNIFGINPYFSWKVSDKQSVYPTIANVGLNIFVFKPDGKFSGGVFVELPDIQNNLEDMKDEPNLRDPITRLSFGLVGKLSIGSLFAPNF